MKEIRKAYSNLFTMYEQFQDRVERINKLT